MESTEVRLNKFIANTGICSRRKADELIQLGKIKVNGKIVNDLGYKISLNDFVEVEGKVLKSTKYLYVLFYKPAGYITSCHDEKNRKTIYSLLPEQFKILKPVGRLDKDTSGLLLLTNDGQMIYRLTHPKYQIAKGYIAVVEGKYKASFRELFAKGIALEPEKLAKAELNLLEQERNQFEAELILHQGYNRQIRKMFESINCQVIHLKRIKVGILSLEGLHKGEYRYLSSHEVNALKHNKT